MTISEPSAHTAAQSIENPRFAAERAAGKTCFEIADLGGCVACWGKGQWLGIDDASWKALGVRAPGSVMTCGHCRGTGLAHRSPGNRKATGAIP